MKEEEPGGGVVSTERSGPYGLAVGMQSCGANDVSGFLLPAGGHRGAEGRERESGYGRVGFTYCSGQSQLPMTLHAGSSSKKRKEKKERNAFTLAAAFLSAGGERLTNLTIKQEGHGSPLLLFPPLTLTPWNAFGHPAFLHNFHMKGTSTFTRRHRTAARKPPRTFKITVKRLKKRLERDSNCLSIVTRFFCFCFFAHILY